MNSKKLVLNIFFLIVILGVASNSNAQNYVGVYDAITLEPLIYANVSLTEIASNKKLQTITDDKGKFEIPFALKTRIVISHIGYDELHEEILPIKTGILYVFPNETEIDEVVITGSATKTSQEESAYDITIIKKETLEKRGVTNLADALKNEINIQINQDGILGSSIKMQGMDGQNVKIMIDGVPVIGRLNGNVDLSQINMGNIDRIEIVEGPLSAIYGTNAIAGVINLISKQNQKNKLEGNANLYYESVGKYNVDAQLGFKKQHHYINVNGGRYFFDGWNPSDYDRDVQWNPKEQYFLGVNYTFRSKNTWFHKWKANYFQDRILNRYDPAGQLPIAFDDWYKTKRVDVSYATNGKLSNTLTFNSNNAYNHYNRIKNRYKKNLITLESNLVPDTEFNDNQDTTSLNQWMSRSFLYWDNHNKIIAIQGGVDLTIENGKGGRFKDEDGSAITMVDASFFLSMPIQATDKLLLMPALRYGYNNKYTKFPTPSFQIKYAIHNNLIYRLNYGMGYRTPSLKELYLAFDDANHTIFGNTDLNAERSNNISTSIHYSKKITSHDYGMGANFFYNNKYDAIELVPNKNFEYTYKNISQISSLGAQLNVSYSFKGFSCNTGVSYTGLSNDLYNQDNNLSKYFFYPEIQSNLEYSFKKINLSFHLFNKWNGPKYNYRIDDNDETIQVEIEGYDLMDFSVQKGFWQKRINITVGINNILNVTNIVGSTSGAAHGSEGNQAQIGTGRSYFIGLKISSKQ